jgi:hypothetical protein
VVYREIAEQEELDSDGNLVIKTVPRLVKHMVFNLECCDKVEDPKAKNGSTFSASKSDSYNFMKSSDQSQGESANDTITQKQRLFLIKLIESRYEDERTKAGLLNRINQLSKVEAKQTISRMLQEAR